ncbi:MAG: UDP-N-acetylmuramoyl-L-alanine--D-glutamate ligase [Candidatus Moraniibacteriota bacterium]|nr:MAG: UDP-N-acetylmuramoyl-L-alanine--D-glutamate ligase [Candidatus Moranbacteria bacterium]
MADRTRATKFVFDSYAFSLEEKRASFTYRMEFENREPMIFIDELFFPELPETMRASESLIDAVLRGVHIALGVSYYKLSCPVDIEVSHALSEKQAVFWNTVYRKGLGEFFFRNNIDPRGRINFPFDRSLSPGSFAVDVEDRALLGIGGGKDSIVAGELLKKMNVSTSAFIFETGEPVPLVERVVEEMALPTVKVRHVLDRKVFDGYEGSYNGHVPFSAMVAWTGYLAAALCGYRYVVVGNERSSNVGNVDYFGETVNHQWSKSVEFETMFQEYAREFLSPDIVYFSLLRPFYEIRVAEMFSQYDRYFSLFSSCNRSFRVRKHRPETLWCGECAKCAFVFLLLSAFVKKEALVGIFGKNMLDDEALLSLFGDVLGFGSMKPFDCVGTFEEARAALFLSRERFGTSRVSETFLSSVDHPEQLVRESMRFFRAETVPARFLFAGAKNALILGYGNEGKSTERYLKQHLPHLPIGIADKSADDSYLDRQKEYDVAIKTPGMPKRLVTIPYTTATNIFFSQTKNLTIGVTGTKGKSTTASLINAILRTAGRKSLLLGNIGQPLLSAFDTPLDPATIIVAELSSYQLDDVEYSPHIAVLLNLFSDHMNYHGSVDAYHEAKRNVVRFQNDRDFAVYNETNPKLSEWVREGKGRPIPIHKSGRGCETYETKLLGAHNAENIRAAVSVARLLGISEEAIREGIRIFNPLPHRLERVGEFRGITFYDDAISTTPESTEAALEAIPNVSTILLGGEDRGYDFRQLEQTIRACGVRNIVLFPESGKRILSSFEGLTVLETDNMEAAIRFAYKQTPPGSICLLSTASPSYSLWKNFEQKGDEFQRLVKKFGEDIS